MVTDDANSWERSAELTWRRKSAGEVIPNFLYLFKASTKWAYTLTANPHVELTPAPTIHEKETRANLQLREGYYLPTAVVCRVFAGGNHPGPRPGPYQPSS